MSVQKPRTPPEQQINNLQNYQQHSRLHFIGQWKTKMKDYLAQCYEEHPNWNHGNLSEQRSFIHMDLDAFFCSIQLSKPEYAHLREKPVGIAAGHANSDISSCNYVARQQGVSAGMYVNRAREICPDLVTLGYDFPSCERVVKLLYRIVFENFPPHHKMAMEVYSIDEIMIATDTEDLQELQVFCEKVRQELKEATGCTVSCGVGPNVMLSRLVTSLAKPDGIYLLQRHDVKEFIRGIPFSEIHGAGESTVSKVKHALLEKKLLQLPTNHPLIDTYEICCRDVQLLSKADLQDTLGKKAGEKFFLLCRGDDDRIVVRTGDDEAEENANIRRPASVGCSMNYAVRPKTEEDVWHIISQVLSDVCEKLRRKKILTNSLRLSILERHPLHPKAPGKFLGRGKCIEVNFPIRFPMPLAWNQHEVMLEAIQKVVKPILVLKRESSKTEKVSKNIGEDDAISEEDVQRAILLGVADDTEQIIWTVKLDSVPDLLVEDIRGLTIQASHLEAEDKGAAPKSAAKLRKAHMRELDGDGKHQLTLNEIFQKAKKRKRDFPVHSVETLSSSSDASNDGIDSVEPISSGRPSKMIFGVTSGRSNSQHSGCYEVLNTLLYSEFDGAFSEQWRRGCKEACALRDYPLVKSYLRCVAMKLVEKMNRSDSSLAGLQEELKVYIDFATFRLPFEIAFW